MRREIQNLALRKLARKPYGQLGKNYENLYETFAEIRRVALSKLANLKKADEKILEPILKKDEQEEQDKLDNKIDTEMNDDKKKKSENLVILD